MQNPGFWRLVGAYFMDFVLVQVIGFIIALFMGNALVVGYFAAKYAYFGTAVHQGWGMAITTIIILFILEWLYFSLLDGKLKGTFGKRCFSLCVFSNFANTNSFYKGSMAYLVDLILVKPIGFAITSLVVFCGIMAFFPSSNWGLICLLVFSILFPTCWSSVYFAICESRWGKTLGKKLMGLQVVQDVPANKNK